MSAQVCHYNPQLGRALVYEPDGRIFTLEINGSGQVTGPTLKKPRLHVGMWLQPAESQTIEVDAYPYPFLQTMMSRQYRIRSLTRWFIYTIDTTLTDSARRESARLFESIARTTEHDTLSSFERVILAILLPGSASRHNAPFPKDGVGAKLLAKMVDLDHRPTQASMPA